jgi:hypothetical protein
MAYDLTAVVVAGFLLWLVLRDGRISKPETIILALCCLILGGTSWVSGMLHPLFGVGVNAYVVALCIGGFLLYKFLKGRFVVQDGYLMGICGVVLGSSQIFTSWLPPMVNGVFAMLGGLVGSIGQ